jgi:diguanylate cyclase (GGDEF)-like protein/PAS domain S-box-containing protein
MRGSRREGVSEAPASSARHAAPPPPGREATLAAQAERIGLLETILELAPVGIGVLDWDGTSPLTNATMRRLLGYSAQEFAITPFSEYSHPEDNRENLRLFALLAAGDIERFAMEKRFFRKDGSVLWASLTVCSVRGDDGRPAYSIAMTQDISDRRALEHRLRAAEKHYRQLVERVPAVVFTAEAGATGRWYYVSPQIETLLGYTPDEWIADPHLWLDRVVEEDRSVALAADQRGSTSASSGPVWVSYRLRHRDGSVVWVRDIGVARPGRDGKVVLNGVLVDITQEKLLEEALAEQAIHDPLTGLVNRAHFRQRAERALTEAADGGPPVSMLFVDLDGFKAVNDTLGHGPGDEVLALAARRMGASVPDDCVLARLGGDEFAVLVTGASTELLADVAERVLTSLAEPVPVGGSSVVIGASIGGRVAKAGDTTDTLLHDADQAMYRAKSTGGGRFVLHGA